MKGPRNVRHTVQGTTLAGSTTSTPTIVEPTAGLAPVPGAVAKAAATGLPSTAHHWALRYPPPEATTPDHLTAFCRLCHEVMTLLRGFLGVGGDARRFLDIFVAALVQAGETVPRTGRALRVRGGYGACRWPDAAAGGRAAEGDAALGRLGLHAGVGGRGRCPGALACADVVAEGVGALHEPRRRRAACRRRPQRIRPSIERTFRMRVKLLRDDAGATVRLVYPSTLDEYGEAFETLGALAAPAGDGGPDAGRDHVGGSYVVTTESQRARWQLPDLWTSGRARVVDESEAFGLLRATPADPPPPTRWDNGPNGPASEALRALAAPDPRLDQALEALERVDLPGGVCETLRRELRRTFTSRTVGKMLDREPSRVQGRIPRRAVRSGRRAVDRDGDRSGQDSHAGGWR